MSCRLTVGGVRSCHDLDPKSRRVARRRSTRHGRRRGVNSFDETGPYEAFTNGTLSPERLNSYWATIPLYELRDEMFYSVDRFPDGPTVTVPADLANYRLCGVRGYNVEALYAVYDFPDALKINQALLSLKHDGTFDGILRRNLQAAKGNP